MIKCMLPSLAWSFPVLSLGLEPGHPCLGAASIHIENLLCYCPDEIISYWLRNGFSFLGANRTSELGSALRRLIA
ncbi:uncharacterized protein BO80DRAFT_421654 [Aspergillus ibericus CBS 121593]|uniref:Secreted protein n=1 Tax=Aspergillus ibericus CBS 121593 TaxID=1448316 RepID=A0A395HBY0_9EURO|nr:hypothetical protein BO80DRAFT_421654 [Aspergillus ibericus CBS 121593]RAL05013.1 hypothetical protein BO80DRAFT_421654 [Aspergillus ibericus CBS 121593]